MTVTIIKEILLVLVLLHAIRTFIEERAQSNSTKKEEPLTRWHRTRLFALVLVQIAARSSPIGYYGLELFDGLVG